MVFSPLQGKKAPLSTACGAQSAVFCMREKSMNERILALDVGDRRIGIAVSDSLGLTAQPIETYTRVGYGPDTRHIAALAAQHDTSRILCGLPRNMDGTQGGQAQKVREFAAQLEQAGLSVEYYDERMTTMVAESALLEANMSRADRKKKVDMVAAVVILQSYLDAQAARKTAQQQADDEPEADGQENDGVLGGAQDGDVLEMEDEDGNLLLFELSAEIEYKGEQYVLLVCTQGAGDVQENESVIMRCVTDADGAPCYQSLDDERLIDAVYAAYLRQSEAEE